MKSSKIAIIVGIVAVVIIAAALTAHFRLSESEKSEVQSGAEQNEKESASQVANEILDSLQNKPESESVEQNEGSESNESTEQTENIVPNAEQNMISDQIEISAIEVDEVYGWSISNETNPTITIAANVDNVIQITNLTDVQHDLVIESDGKEIAASGDIGPYLSGKLSVNPSMTGTFGYHCQYHPDTMKGTIIVKP